MFGAPGFPGGARGFPGVAMMGGFAGPFGAAGVSAVPPQAKICFSFVNTGMCERGAACKFRHLAPNHPDAIADRMARGR